MPYIKAEDRARAEHDPKTAGELNYAITMLVKGYVKEGLSYQRINDIMGALEGAKLEMYRRVAVPYENAKMAENGDVW